jgi:O-antigen/teichoic acid export membrane protein
VLAEPLIDLLYGDDYSAAVVPLRLLGVVLALYGINQLTAVLVISRYRPGAFRGVLIAVLVQNVVCNLVLIPLLEADGAALSAALSALLLGILSVRVGAEVTGGVNVARAFAGPALAGAVMAGVLVPLSLPLGPAIVLGGAVYLAVLALWERTANREDLGLVLDTLRRHPRTSALAGS